MTVKKSVLINIYTRVTVRVDSSAKKRMIAKRISKSFFLSSRSILHEVSETATPKSEKLFEYHKLITCDIQVSKLCHSSNHLGTAHCGRAPRNTVTLYQPSRSALLCDSCGHETLKARAAACHLIARLEDEVVF